MNLQSRSFISLFGHFSMTMFFSMKNGTFSLYSPPDWATSNLSDSSSFWKYATLGINHVMLLPKLNHVIDLGSYQNIRCLLHLFCVLTGPISSMPNIIITPFCRWGRFGATNHHKSRFFLAISFWFFLRNFHEKIQWKLLWKKSREIKCEFLWKI